jgi:signal transduction histidine kinase
VRRRLTLAVVGSVALSLVIAGAGSLLLTRASTQNQAAAQLVSEADALTSDSSGVQSLAVLRAVRRVLELEDALVVRVNVAGRVLTPLPGGLEAAEIEPEQLLAGQTVSGRQGNLVFAAAPIPLTSVERARLKLAGTLAVVLTRQVGDLGPSWTYFLLAGGAALLVAWLVAWQMSRRIARPLVEAVAATERIAGGDLHSRVPERPGDYGELSTLARSINTMAQNLQDSRARERDLLLSVSHDLRTPLTSIRGFAEAITDGAAEDTAQAAGVITAEARRLERLVGDLLELTKLEASQLSITMRPTDVAEVAATTTEGFRPLAERAGIRLAVQLPSGADGAGRAVAGADPDRLAQLLANLIENAISFARTTVAVSVWAPAPADRHVSVTVDDDGPGIPADELSRVFQRFYRTDRGPRRQIGSGLGLAIVAELASAMGGTVRAQSPTGAEGGTRFVVSLARSPGAPAPQAAAGHQHPPVQAGR